MVVRRVALLAAIAIVACGGAERPAPETPSHPIESTAIDAGVDAAEPPVPVTEATVEAEPQEPEEETAAPAPEGPPDLGPIDQRATPCFPDPRATRFASSPQRHPDGQFETTISASARFDRFDQLRVSPGTTVRFEATIENVGTDVLALTEGDVAALRELHVMGLAASWTLPLDTPSELRAGQRLAPGAVIRLCATVEIAREPIDAAPPGEQTRAYAIDFPSGHHQGLGTRGGYFAMGRRTIVVRYPASRGVSVREPESWGGILRVRIAEGASLLTIARETGVRIGSGVRPFASERVPVPHPSDELLVEAPETMRVADAAAALAARPDVLSAAPILRGEPGSEGCSDYSPCARGEQCCYMCGIPGCASSCFHGRSCPTGIP